MIKDFVALRQLEMTDCGPACIQMICLHYGKRYSLDFIKRDISISRIGVTMADVKDACERLGLETVVAQGTVSQLAKAPLPAILHWRGNHFVVLYHVGHRQKGNIYYIADPSYGKIRFGERDFVRHWYGEDGRGFAVFTSPSQAFRQCNEVKSKQNFSVLKNFISKLKKQKIKLLLALLCMLIAAGCNWVIPVLYQKVIDYGVIGQNLNVVWQLFLAQLSFFIGHMLSNSLSSILLMKLNFYVGIEYVAELLGKMIRLPIKYFDTRLNTDFIQRLDDYQRLQSIMTYDVIEQLFSVVNIVVCSLLLARYSVTSLVLFFVISILSFVWNLYFLRERKFLDYSRFTEQARNRNILYELINGMPDIKVNNAQETQVRVWMDNQKHINEITMKSLMLNYKQMVGSTTINKFRDILIVALCAYMTVEADMTLGVLMSVSYILGQLAAPMATIQRLAQSVQDAKLSMDRLAEVQQKEDESNGDGLLKINFKQSIGLRQVTFKYEGSFNPNVFSGLSVEFPKNRTTAIVGNSGSGKTTLVKLLLGFYHPQQGTVEIDGVSLRSLDVNDWRARCGVVLQGGYIFSGTIAENIALGEKVIDYDKVERCARMACIDGFVQRLPSRYKMKIGNGGIDLSEGQKQRILIARAVYKNPELIIFDEATSSLDTVNERHIMDNLQQFFRERTVIVVAHRLSTVVNADNIIYLEDGKIAEQGTHKELVELKGKYYELIKNQLGLEH